MLADQTSKYADISVIRKSILVLLEEGLAELAQVPVRTLIAIVKHVVDNVLKLLVLCSHAHACYHTVCLVQHKDPPFGGPMF